MNAASIKKVLNVGSGPKLSGKLHTAFSGDDWREVRLDIDENVAPDIVGCVTNMRDVVPDNMVDAVWSSHNLEHLYAHEVPQAVQEFRRILRPDGFALINCPDIMAIAQLIIDGQFDTVAYMSAAGPIAALDMLWGHSQSIAAGNYYMAHKTGFTDERLGRLLIEGGFAEAWAFPGRGYEIWAVGLMEDADRKYIRKFLSEGGIEFPK